MTDNGQLEENQDNLQEGTSQATANDPDLVDPVISNIYMGAARELVSSLIDPTDKELCTLWLDFIIIHINEEPVVFDYLKLFLLSLQQAVRMPPFDDLPPQIEEIKNFDVIAMGRKMIESYRTYLEEKNRVHSSTPEKQEDPGCKLESVPLIEFGSTAESKEFFATQKIPFFGRQCYYTLSANEQPFWWPIEPGMGCPEDYLSRIAWFMYWEENRKMSKLDECSHKTNVTSKTWWKDAMEFKKKQERDLALGFKWYPLSLLPHSRAKLDRRAIEKYFKNVGNKGMEVFAIDENAESIKDKPIPDGEKLTIAQTLQDLLDKRRHGTIGTRKGATDILQEHLREHEYNSDWYTTFVNEDEAQRAAQTTESFLRKVQENSIKRLLQTSPECVNVEEEAQIRQLRALYSGGRGGEQPPPPSPEDISEHDLLRKGVSWKIPAFKRLYADETAEESKQATEAGVSRPPVPRRLTFGKGGKIHHSTMLEGGGTDPCTTLNVVPQCVSSIEYAPEVPQQRQPSPCRVARSREVSPAPQVPSPRGFSKRQMLRSQVNETYTVDNEDDVGFGAQCQQMDPQSFATGGEMYSRRASPPGNVEGPCIEKRDSLGFAEAEELDFMDQFLVPTADIEFDENIQEAFDQGYTYAEEDTNWTAPPEEDFEAAYEMGLPPIAEQAQNETFDRREGRLFETPCQRRVECIEEDLGPINWPTTEHLYDINVDFPEDEPPFEFLDNRSPCGEAFPECVTYGDDDAEQFERMRWRDLSLVADQMGFHNF